MNGSELFVKTAAASGVKICFTNPGTTELPLVRAFDAVPGIRSVLCLFEGCCTGAADGYGRMTDSPAMTLLHLGPGLANGLANLHNARRAGTKMLNVVGEHALWHRPLDPPLAMDIEKLLQTVSGWKNTMTSADRISKDAVAAIEASERGMIASLAFPYDLQLSEVQEEVVKPRKSSFHGPDPESVESAEKALRKKGRSALILGGRGLNRETLLKAAEIRSATGCELYCETFPARMEKGRGLPALKRVPYLHHQAVAELSGFQAVILAGAREPISFFGWPGSPGRYLTEKQEVVWLADDPMAVEEAMTLLAGAFHGTVDVSSFSGEPAGFPMPSGELTGASACSAIAALQPEGAIVVDEAITSGELYFTASHSALPHTVLTLTGGAIGSGIPLATGAALACPDRPVVNLQGDGSAMFTLQALWTQARESLNITTLICSNRSYDILKLEMAMAGNIPLGPQSEQAMVLDHPPLDWVSLGKGLGVPSVAVSTTGELEKALKRSFSEPGPSLIEMKLSRLF